MNRLHKVTVLFFETPATFFVVRETNEDDFNHICDTLTGMEWEFGTNHRVVGEPELGELYVTRCTRDDRVRKNVHRDTWYVSYTTDYKRR